MQRLIPHISACFQRFIISHQLTRIYYIICHGDSQFKFIERRPMSYDRTRSYTSIPGMFPLSSPKSSTAADVLQSRAWPSIERDFLPLEVVYSGNGHNTSHSIWIAQDNPEKALQGVEFFHVVSRTTM